MIYLYIYIYIVYIDMIQLYLSCNNTYIQYRSLGAIDNENKHHGCPSCFSVNVLI